MMRNTFLVAILGLLAMALLAPAPAHADSRWLYAGSNNGVSFYVDAYTIGPTVSGHLSMFVRAVTASRTYQERLVIDLEARNYCFPDTDDPYWKAIPPESVLEQIWACAYLGTHPQYGAR